MKMYTIYGVKMTSFQEMMFSKYISNHSIAMNTKTALERFEIAEKWLQKHLAETLSPLPQ